YTCFGYCPTPPRPPYATCLGYCPTPTPGPYYTCFGYCPTPYYMCYGYCPTPYSTCYGYCPTPYSTCFGYCPLGTRGAPGSAQGASPAPVQGPARLDQVRPQGAAAPAVLTQAVVRAQPLPQQGGLPGPGKGEPAAGGKSVSAWVKALKDKQA